MTYQPFNEDWEKEVNRMPIPLIKSIFPQQLGEDFPTKKAELIKALRAQLIVKQFNEQFPVGCKLMLKLVPHDDFEAIQVTVDAAAFVQPKTGEPIAFFKEKSGFCYISPEYVPIQGYSYQFQLPMDGEEV